MVKKIIILIAFLGLYPSLKAYHSEKSYNIGNTAYTLKDSEMLLGLSSFRYGWSDNFQMETYYLPWFINAFNLGFKYKWQLSEKDFLALNPIASNLAEK